jgi:heme exporter protein A
MELKATALTKRFKRLVLFQELSLTVRPGMSVAVIGPNGSGKSTLLQIMAGLQWPTKGTVSFSVEGQEVAREEQLLQIGFVAPYINLYTDFTARENLSFLAKARRLPNAPERIDALLDRVGLAGRGDDPLSGRARHQPG